MRTALTIAVAAVLLALAGCSSGAVENAATTSASSAAPSSTAPARTHQVMYSFNVQGPGGPIDSPFTYVNDNGSTVTERTGGILSLKVAHLPEGRIAMVNLGVADGATNSYCSIIQDGRTVATQTSTDPKNPASCSYIVH